MKRSQQYFAGITFPKRPQPWRIALTAVQLVIVVGSALLWGGIATYFIFC